MLESIWPALLQQSACWLLCIMLLFQPGGLRAQDSVNIDTRFEQARALAFGGAYAQSRQLCRQLLQLAPHHTDAALLMGNTFAWQQQFDSARMVLLPLLARPQAPEAAFLALANTERWAGNLAASWAYCRDGLAQYPASVDLLLAGARALLQLEDEAAAAHLLQKVLAMEPGNQEAQQLQSSLKQQAAPNSIKALYQISFFGSAMAPWQLGMLEYQYSATAGKYLARINYAEQFAQQSVQGELEAYPVLGEKWYAYLNAGISDNRLFPAYRAGAELFRRLPYGMEVSAGARSLFFEEQTVLLYTGHLGKYFSNYWIAARPFLQTGGNSPQLTAVFQLRRYLRQEGAYLGLMVAGGGTPLTQVGLQEISRSNAYRLGLQGQFRLGRRLMAGAELAYESEEYQQNNMIRRRFTSAASLHYLFLAK